MPQKSAAFRRSAQQLAPSDRPLILLELSHALLAVPLQFVNDNQDVTSNGRRYVACDFQFVWPDDQDQQAPAAQLSIGNLRGGLGAFFERTHGGTGTRIVARQVMRSNPDFIEDELRLDLRNIEVTMTTVSGQLSYANILDKPGTAYTFRPETAPGIF
ncbi:DUF1833 family protein [Burkholderia gladioli]|uniref:DUF1833 family protein n=1 Tax=Burkholderia gladioli TaxID=28095 RepID=UPI00164227ED|nr:DUF1833 family protein [Burkholderia gladioli]